MTARILPLCLFALLLALPVVAAASVIDRSVAVVNEDTITLSEVNEVGKSIFQKVAEETPPGTAQRGHGAGAPDHHRKAH